MSETTIDYIVRVHEEGDSLWAEVLDLPGCFASGANLEELREALQEAISLYVGAARHQARLHRRAPAAFRPHQAR